MPVRASDTTTLPRLLKARGFKPPEQFKALVISLGRPGRNKALAPPRVFSYGSTATDRENWWPASTVKLYAAIAALEVTHEKGLRPTARATFKYAEGERKGRISGLVHMALVPSNNLAFDRLVEIVGAARLNDVFFTPAKGFTRTVMQRSYFGRVRLEPSGVGTNRHSPAITLSDGRKSVDLPERNPTTAWDCPDEGNCTTLIDLAEALRRVMLHERLPASQRFALGPAELKVLRRALSHRKKRGNGVVDGLAKGYGKGLEFAHKPGYSRKWFSDAVFARDTRSGRAWLVAMAGYPGRGALDKAAQHVGALLRRLR